MKIEKVGAAGNKGEERYYVGLTKKELRVLAGIIQRELNERCPKYKIELQIKRDYLRNFLKIIDEILYVQK